MPSPSATILLAQKLRLIRTLKRSLMLRTLQQANSNADPYASFPEERYFIDRKASEDRNQFIGTGKQVLMPSRAKNP